MEQNMSIVVFNMLPTSVQSRIPRLDLLRRSTSLSILSSRHRSMPQQKDMEQVVVARRDESSVVELQANGTLEEPPKYPGAGSPVSDASSGVKWRYAEQGSFLQHSALRETTDLAFSRKSYIDSVAYMLKGLPDNMDDYETSVIRRALPTSCALEDANGRIEAGPGRLGWQSSPEAKTLLHSATQGFVAVVVLFGYCLLSFLAVVIRAGAYYERQYNVSQYLISGGVNLATVIGKHSGSLGEKISAMGEGKLGKVISDLVAWALASVTAGVHDGIGQGLLLIEQRRK